MDSSSARLRRFGLAALALLIPALSSAAYRVGKELAVSPPASRVLDTSSSFGSAATFDGLQYVAFWSDVRGMRREIFGARFTVTGELLDPMAIPVGTGAVNLVSPKAVWTGSRHLVLAHSDDPNEPPTAYLLGMAPDGTVLHPPRKVGLSGGSLVVIDGRVLLIRGAADGMVIEALDRDGSPLGEARQFPGRSVAVAAAAARSNALTVWIDANGLGSVRVDREGQVLDATPMRIAAGLVGQPAVASDGEDFLVVWFSSDRLLVRRVSAGGVLSPVITVATGLDAYSNNPGVTWTDGHYAIVYRAGLTMKVAKLDGNDRIDVSDFAEGAVHSIAVAGTPAAAVWAAVGEDSTVIVTKQLSGGSPELVLSRGAARQRDPQLRARAGGGFDVSWVQSDRSIQRPGLFTTTFVGCAGGEVRELVAPAGGGRRSRAVSSPARAARP